MKVINVHQFASQVGASEQCRRIALATSKAKRGVDTSLVLVCGTCMMLIALLAVQLDKLSHERHIEHLPSERAALTKLFVGASR